MMADTNYISRNSVIQHRICAMATSAFRHALWQSVSRHLDIGESTESTASLLAEHAALGALLTQRLDTDHRRVRVVAAWPANANDKAASEIQLAESDWNRLERWM